MAESADDRKYRKEWRIGDDGDSIVEVPGERVVAVRWGTGPSPEWRRNAEDICASHNASLPPKALDCRGCLHRYETRGQGECWTECNHRDHGRPPYQNILWGCQEGFTEVPPWCPLGLGGKGIGQDTAPPSGGSNGGQVEQR
jgi:ribosomal protein L40E